MGKEHTTKTNTNKPSFPDFNAEIINSKNNLQLPQKEYIKTFNLDSTLIQSNHLFEKYNDLL